MPQRIQLARWSDFTGGLNLRADQYDLRPGESPDMMNVDVDPRGGINLRKVTVPFNATALSSPIDSIWQFSSSDGTQQVLISYETKLARSTGANFTDISGITQTSGLKHRATTFKDVNYIQNGTDGAVRWDGSAATRLGTSFNDDITNPTGGNMPKAKLVASHQGSVWVANTDEGVALPNRVRWSHPNFPEDWRSFDFIDVDTGHDGDEITALVPFADRLLVFKRNSIHAIYGYSPETFQVFPVSQVVGAPSQEAVVATDVGTFFFSWPEGVFAYKGKSPEFIFERLKPAIEDGSIPDQAQDKIALGWGRRRVWASVPHDGSSDVVRTFVYDPTLSKEGSWVQYDIAFKGYLEWQPPGADALFLGIGNGVNRVIKLEQEGSQDDFGSEELVDVTSWYTTRWFDVDEASLKKKFKRPDLVLQGGNEVRVFVQTFKDYDYSSVLGSFYLETVADSAALIWDDGTGDVGGQWDNFVWARDNADAQSVVTRGAFLGSGRSVALKFNGPVGPSKQWGINSISWKFFVKKIR